MSAKSFAPRAAARAAGLSEEQIRFGGEEARRSAGKPKGEGCHRVCVVFDDEAYWALKGYLARPESRYRTISDMVRKLVEDELAGTEGLG